MDRLPLAHAIIIRIKSESNINGISFISRAAIFREDKSFGLHLSILRWTHIPVIGKPCEDGDEAIPFSDCASLRKTKTD